jgi:hypothetical protein
MTILRLSNRSNFQLTPRRLCPSGWWVLLIGGIASQPHCPQPRRIFSHRLQSGLVIGHRLLGLTQLLFFLEQRSRAALRLI